MVGERPTIVVVNNEFRNVPEVAMGAWMFRTPGNTAVECYAIDPGNQTAESPARDLTIPVEVVSE